MWVIMRIDGYDHKKQVGSMRVASWYPTEKERDEVMKGFTKPGWVALKKPWTDPYPDTDRSFKVKPGLDKNLDRAIERLRKHEQKIEQMQQKIHGKKSR